MNIPQIIIQDRQIISLEIYKYHQFLAKKLAQKRKYFENNNNKIALSYDKEKIITWFANLNIQERVKVCSIYNNWLTKIIFQLMTYTKYDSVVEFSPTQLFEEFSKNKNNIFCGVGIKYQEIIKEKFKEIRNFDDFFSFFKGENNVKKSSGTPSSGDLKHIQLNKFRENEFIKEIRFLSLNEFNDTITLSLDLINNPYKMIEYFNYFSNGECFISEIKPIIEENKCYNFSFPNWIYKYNSYTIYQLLTIFFEQIISIYYQIYFAEKEIPQFDIDKKINELFKTNSEIEEYLSKNFLNKENYNFDFIDKEKIFRELNCEKQTNLIRYYENKIEIVYSYAFASKYDGKKYKDNLQKLGFMNNKIRQLKNICQLDIKAFINKISFIESEDAFLYSNFIYSTLYNQLIEQRLNQYCKELLIEEEQKKNNKIKKNKKRKNKKKKNTKQSINENISNNINENIDKTNTNLKKEEENVEDNNDDVEEEIEEIPSDMVVLKKNELNEGESNNIASNNDFNNSTVSSSCTNKYSKDLNSLGPKYNNFFNGDKKDEEMLIKIEMEDLSEDNNREDIKEEKEENEKFKLEDISENEISEDRLFKEDIYNSTNENKEDITKKKKKKNKKRKKKKQKTTEDNNIDSNINNNKESEENKINLNTAKENKILETTIDNKNIIPEPKEKVFDQIEKNIIKDNKEEKNNTIIEEVKENPNKINSEEKMDEKNNNINEIKVLNNDISKEEKSNEIKTQIIQDDDKNIKKNKRKKDFFLYPVHNSNKKKGNKNKGKNSKNEDIDKKSSEINNISVNNVNNIGEQTSKINTNENNINKKENSTQTEDLSEIENKNLIIHSSNNTNNKEYIKINESKIEFLGNKDKSIKDKIKKDNIEIQNEPIKGITSNTNEKKNDQNFQNNLYFESNSIHNNYYNNLFYLNQPQYFNFAFYPFNNSLYLNQNEFFNNLSKEIMDFENTVDHNLNIIRIYKEQVINNMKNFISKVLSDEYDFEFCLYGSYSTGLCIEISDIDILIKFKIKNKNNIDNFSNEQNIENIISLIEKALNKNKELLKISQINPIYTASVPVLKIECKLNDLIPENIQNEIKKTYLFNFENEILKMNFDFTFHEVNNFKEKKLTPSQEIINYIKDVIKEYSNIRPLLLVLKRYTHIKKLNSSFHGGISSYSLFLLLYAYILQIFGKCEVNKDYLKLNLGKELLGFFSFYSNINFGLYSIDVKKNSPLNLLDKIHENGILLIDPITGLNVAKSTFRIEQIKYAFNNTLIIMNNLFYKRKNNKEKEENNNILKHLFNRFNSIYNDTFISNEKLTF